MENGQANVAVINAEETTNFLEVATNTTGIDWDIFCCKHGKNKMDLLPTQAPAEGELLGTSTFRSLGLWNMPFESGLKGGETFDYSVSPGLSFWELSRPEAWQWLT